MTEPKRNVLDRVITFFDPQRAARRQAARHMLDLDASYFRGARSSRLTYNWSTGQESVDAAMYGELQTLRDRSRDLNRNNAIASGITDTICANAIHTGLTPQARINFEDCGLTKDEAALFQRRAESVYEKWEPWAAADGRLWFREIQYLAARQIAESGEFLALRRALPVKKGRPYLLALDVMEPDRLADPGRTKQNMRFGIESNAHGRPTFYHIRQSHPGDPFFTKKDAGKFKRVPAADRQGRTLVYHIFPVLRPGQTRGIPFLTPVIEQFKFLADYTEATIVAARVSACFAAFITGNQDPYTIAGGHADETDDNANRLETLEPGIIEYLADGKDVKFGKPEQPTTTFSDFTERILRMIGASLGLPYELVIKDFSKTNYSSARAALLQAYRVFLQWAQMIRLHLCQPIWEMLIEEAWLRGELPAPGFMAKKWAFTRAEWIHPGWAWVDPKKEAEANKIAVQMGFNTRADVCAGQGGDWEAKAEQAAREKTKYEALGLKYDISEKETNAGEPKTDEDE